MSHDKRIMNNGEHWRSLFLELLNRIIDAIEIKGKNHFTRFFFEKWFHEMLKNIHHSFGLKETVTHIRYMIYQTRPPHDGRPGARRPSYYPFWRTSEDDHFNSFWSSEDILDEDQDGGCPVEAWNKLHISRWNILPVNLVWRERRNEGGWNQWRKGE